MKSSPAEHIVGLLERLGRLLSTETHAEGMLPVHWETLRYLSRANRFSRTPAALTAYLGLTKGTVSQTLNALENRGLVNKRINQADRRSKLLGLTARGRKILLKDPLAETIDTVRQLSDPSRDALTASLQLLLSRRLTAQNRQPFGQCQDCRFFARRHADGDPHYCLLLKEKLAEGDILEICFEQQPKQPAEYTL